MVTGPETEEWLAETATGDSYVLLSLPTELLTVPDPEPTPVAGPSAVHPCSTISRDLAVGPSTCPYHSHKSTGTSVTQEQTSEVNLEKEKGFN